MKTLNYGKTATGKTLPLRVDAQGRLITDPNLSTGAGSVDADTARVTVAQDDKLFTILGEVASGPAASDTGVANFQGLFKRALQNWTSLLGRIPTLGQKTKAESMPVVLPSDEAVNVFQQYASMGSGPVVGPGNVSAQRVTIADDSVLMYSMGRWDDAPATTDTGNFTLMQFVKRAMQNWTTYLSRVPGLGSALVSACTPVAAPKKLTVNGFTPVALLTAYTNLLDSAAGTAALDVSDYQSGDLVIISTATTGSYTIQAALDSAFTSGVHALQVYDKTVQNAVPANGAVTPTAATRIWQLNLQGVNFLRVNLSGGITAGTIRAFAVLNQAPFFPFQLSLNSAQNLGTLSTVSAISNAGTPAAPATPYFVNSAATTNGALILAGTSGLQAFWATNTGAAAAFVKLYNKATAPTVGTDVPEMIIPVPAAVGGVPGVAQITPGVNGYRFPLGLGIAITGGVADSDTTAVAASHVKVKLSRTV